MRMMDPKEIRALCALEKKKMGKRKAKRSLETYLIMKKIIINYMLIKRTFQVRSGDDSPSGFAPFGQHAGRR